jgi:hypothetical protein
MSALSVFSMGVFFGSVSALIVGGLAIGAVGSLALTVGLASLLSAVLFRATWRAYRKLKPTLAFLSFTDQQLATANDVANRTYSLSDDWRAALDSIRIPIQFLTRRTRAKRGVLPSGVKYDEGNRNRASICVAPMEYNRFQARQFMPLVV